MNFDEDIFEECCEMLAQRHYAVIDHFLTSQEVSDLLVGLENKYTQKKFKKAGVGQDEDLQVDAQVRGDFIYWIDPEKDFEIKRRFVPCMNGFMDYVKKEFFLPIKDYEMHYSVYPEGTYYQRHLDQFKKDDSRVLTFICYLNFSWAAKYGGALRLYTKEDDKERYVDILPEAGRFVCFRSDLLEHEVLPTQRVRYSLSGWMLNRKRSLKFLK
ncbi:MAG: 2OG-Fe(II) oxygenase [Candidatus Omnitrophica bacterium]|nr:2OG-Fe(II) oxygenase [Candidatus Omnitrophota bacterium]